MRQYRTRTFFRDWHLHALQKHYENITKGKNACEYEQENLVNGSLAEKIHKSTSRLHISSLLWVDFWPQLCWLETGSVARRSSTEGIVAFLDIFLARASDVRRPFLLQNSACMLRLHTSVEFAFVLTDGTVKRVCAWVPRFTWTLW